MDPLGGGTGLMGPLTMGCGVIALCQDAHHIHQLRTELASKTVLGTVAGETVLWPFGNAVLDPLTKLMQLYPDGAATAKKRKAALAWKDQADAKKNKNADDAKREKEVLKDDGGKRRKRTEVENDNSKPYDKRKATTVIDMLLYGKELG